MLWAYVGMLWAARQGMACQAAHVKLPIASLSKCLAMPRQDMPRQGMPRPRHAKATARRGMPTQGKACCHVKLPISSLSKCLAMPRPSQGKACQGQGKTRPRQDMPTQGQGKACQGQGTTCQRKARHANATPCQASNSLTFSKCLEWGNAKAKARHANASQGKACQASNSLTFSKWLELNGEQYQG